MKCLGWKVYRVTLSNDSDHNSWWATEKGHKWAQNTNSSVKIKKFWLPSFLLICLSLLLDPLLELTVESTSESKSPAVECPPWGLNINNRKIIKDVRKIATREGKQII